ncbi:MAG: hypothetical protein WAR22_04125, partial [Desulfomonilia bacterium]
MAEVGVLPAWAGFLCVGSSLPQVSGVGCSGRPVLLVSMDGLPRYLRAGSGDRYPPAGLFLGMDNASKDRP